MAVKNGLWAVLFTGLLFYIIKDSTKRENKYQEIIKELSEKFEIVKDIKQNVDEIKTVVFSKNKTTKQEKSKEKNNCPK